MSPATKEHPMTTFRRDIERMVPEFRKALPPSISAEMFARAALTAVQNNPVLLKCTGDSVWRALLKACEDRMIPDGREGALVPYRNKRQIEGKWVEMLEAQWLPMRRGLVNLLWGAGVLMDTGVVYDRDEWEYRRGDDPRIIHVPKPGPRNEENVVAAYSVARFKDGRKDLDWMWKEEIDQIKAKSRAERGPWQDPVFYPEMAIKTVIKHHFKNLPTSPEIERALDRDSFLYQDDAVAHRALRGGQEAAQAALPSPDQFPSSLPGEPMHLTERSVETVLERMGAGENVETPKPQRGRRQQPPAGGGPMTAGRAEQLKQESQQQRDENPLANFGGTWADKETGEVREEQQQLEDGDEAGEASTTAENQADETQQASASANSSPGPGATANGQVRQPGQQQPPSTQKTMTADEKEAYQFLVQITNALKASPIRDKQGYLDHLERLLEQADNPGKLQGVRDYVQISSGGKKFGVTGDEIKQVATNVEMARRR